MAGYCLSCGMLRDIDGGACRQCREDEAVRKSADAKAEAAKIKARLRNDKWRKNVNSPA